MQKTGIVGKTFGMMGMVAYWPFAVGDSFRETTESIARASAFNLLIASFLVALAAIVVFAHQ